MANVSDTIGAILVGALVSALLSGAVTTQAFVYLRIYGGDDLRRNTLIVAMLWLLDTTHLSMAFASVWFYLIENWGNDAVYDYIPWTIALTVALTAVVTLISHCFFAHRVYVLSGCSWWLTAPILLLAVGRLAAALVSTFEMIGLHSYEAFVDQVGWVFTTGLSLSTSVDVLITISLIVLLQRSRTGFSTITDHLIDVVTLYTIETGLVTSITTAVSLICWLTMPRNLIFLALHFSISKLYATSTLATLNARKSLRRRTRQPDQQLLPIISSLHAAQSQTERDDHGEELLDSSLKSDLESAINAVAAHPIQRIRTVTRMDVKREDGRNADSQTHSHAHSHSELGVEGHWQQLESDSGHLPPSSPLPTTTTTPVPPPPPPPPLPLPQPSPWSHLYV